MAKYQKYAEYKDSGIDWLGEIPRHWDLKPIKYLFEIINGSTPKSGEEAFWDGEITWITPSDLSKLRSHVIGESIRTITKKGLDSCGTTLVPSDTIILSCRAPIGSLAVTSKEACTNQGCKSLVKKYDLSTKFFYYYLSISTKQLNNLGRGTTFLELSSDELGSYALGIPNAEEQVKIANFLDHETAKIDSLIAKQEKLIELLKEKRQAVISHAVTKGLNPDVAMKDSGVEWLGQVPEHWSVAKIKHLSKIISKGTTPTTMGGDFVFEGIRFLKAENIGKKPIVNSSPEFFITENVDAQLARSRLQEHDVLVIIAGATTGLSSVLQKELLPANTNQAVSFIRPKETEYAKWISYWLSTHFAQSLIWMGAVQAAQPNLSMENLGNIDITLPSVEEIKTTLDFIDTVLLKIDDLIEKNIKAIDFMQERRTALISSAVTGKIDVRHHASRPSGNDKKQTEGI
ncbi:restriction endonuclease subunit S [Acinetobacter sp. AND/436]|uniref:restriction endonuclease subunit S n=1 Tax=Acinetobacter sp. AND/436 TaxID=3414736 RepID=UPI003C2C7BF3